MKQKKILAKLLIVIFLLPVIACKSPQKMIETGDYDGAVYKSLSKLKGKKKRDKFVTTLEEAFLKATQRDVREVERLEQSSREDKWVSINAIHRRIRQRQTAIEPLIPLISSSGYHAKFQFVKVNKLEDESSNNAAAYVYEKGLELLELGRQGDRQAARDAYQNFESANTYVSNYRDTKQLMQEAENLGITHILFSMQNRAPVLLPYAFKEEVLRTNIYDISDRWNEYYTDERERSAFDYEIRLRFDNIEVSPDLVKERQFVETEKVRDGWQYVLDNKGNVAKDSLGNDIKEPKFIEVKANVIESLQNKFARINGYIEFYDLGNNNRRLDAAPFNIEAIFEHVSTSFNGDKRALSKETKNRLGQLPVPFPNDEILLLQLIDELKPVVRSKVRSKKLI